MAKPTFELREINVHRKLLILGRAIAKNGDAELISMEQDLHQALADLAEEQGYTLPEARLVDSEGNVTPDGTNIQYSGGAKLTEGPVGGPEGETA